MCSSDLLIPIRYKVMPYYLSDKEEAIMTVTSPQLLRPALWYKPEMGIAGLVSTLLVQLLMDLWLVSNMQSFATLHRKIIIYHLLLSWWSCWTCSPTPWDVKKIMTTACAALRDKDLQNTLFEFLANTKGESLLMEIDSPKIATWLDGTAEVARCFGKYR
jgi:hypothetical protein